MSVISQMQFYLNSTVNHSRIIEYNNFIKRVSYIIYQLFLSEQYCLSFTNAVVLLKYHTVNGVHANFFELMSKKTSREMSKNNTLVHNQ